MRDLLEQF